MNYISLNLFQNAEFLILAIECIVFASVITFLLKPKDKLKKENEQLQKQTYFVATSIPRKKFSKWDRYFIVLLTGLYALISFHQLGNTKIPTTYWQPSSDHQSIIFQTNGNYDTLGLIGGEGDNNNNLDTYQIGMKNVSIYGSDDNVNYELIHTIEDSSYMQYLTISIPKSYAYIKLDIQNKNAVINEICAFNSATDTKVNLNIVYDEGEQSNYPASLLLDEQDLFITNPTYLDESYFDEVYHVRNAVEIANGQYMYASVHPLLGTNIMAFTISLLGNNPFAWRFAGALFGVLMVPLFYMLAKRLFRSERYSAIATLLFCLDFMHLSTSRIATLEPFSLFFILLMFYWMSEYYYTSFIDTSFKKQCFYLGLCGISMACAWATKWTGCYSSAGLALLFFIQYFKRIKEYRIAYQKDKAQVFEDIHEQLLVEKVLDIYPKRLVFTFIYCCVVFVIFPVIFYFGIHIVDKMWRDGYSIANMIDQIMYTFNYHSKLTATHPFQSQWYQWVLDIRPIWYYINRNGNLAQSISCFSHPLITWASFIAMIYCCYTFVKKRTDSLIIILIGFFSALIPWMVVSRCVFAYHFYPSTPFYLLMLTYGIRYLESKTNNYRLTHIFIRVCIIVFILFLPAVCGFTTTQSYLSGFLTWLPSWNFN